MTLACMLCGAAGGKALALAIFAVFGLMFVGTFFALLGTVLNGDFRETDTRMRPLEAEGIRPDE